jgi:hypothetical protein
VSQTGIDNIDRWNVGVCVQNQNRSKVIKAYQHKGGNAGRTKQRQTENSMYNEETPGDQLDKSRWSLAKTGKLRGLVHITWAHSNGNYDNVNKLTQQLGSMGAVRPRFT